MGVTTTSTITCDGCNETMTGDSSFVMLHPQSNAENPFIKTAFVVCGVECLQQYAATLNLPVAPTE